MDLIQAVVYGIVQGLTEWLPISSTAHIRVLPELVGWQDPGSAFTASIQLGTLFAVVLYFARDLGESLVGWVRGIANPSHRHTTEYRLGWGIVLGTLPIIAIGLLFQSRIEKEWRSLYVVAGALIGMGIVLYAAERFGKSFRKLDHTKPIDGIWVGLWQAISLVPGASRSGSTISGALLAGFDRPTAARFSFLLSVPSVFAAAIYSLWRHRDELLGVQLGPMIVANVASFAVGYATIAFLMSYLQRHGTLVFVVYRILLGALILTLLGTGVLRPDSGIPG